MEDKNQELKKLKARIEELKPIVLKAFDTDEELDRYEKKNKKLFDEYDYTFEKIEKLEWELMTPEEQEQEKETLRLMKLKREGNMY